MILDEFKKFAVRGNLADLAAGIVIGAAFTGVVSSFVNDILMPPIGLALGRVDFQNLFINLSHRHFESVELVGKAVQPDGMKARIREHQLDHVLGRGIAFEDRLQVFAHHR